MKIYKTKTVGDKNCQNVTNEAVEVSEVTSEAREATEVSAAKEEDYPHSALGSMLRFDSKNSGKLRRFTLSNDKLVWMNSVWS